MPVQSANVNTDQSGKATTAYYADRGDGTSAWYAIKRVFNGGDVAQGATTDAAVTNPASSASVVALLKGLLTHLATIITALGTGTTALGKAEDAAHTSGDTGIMALGVRRDTAVASSDTSGDFEPLQTDSIGRLRVSDSATARVGALLNARTTALDNILLVKNAAGTLYGFQGYTDDDGYVVVIADADGTIAGGAQCLEVIPVIDPTGGGAGGPFSLDFGRYGIAVATGICIAFSTTGPTFTDGGNHMFVSAQYE